MNESHLPPAGLREKCKDPVFLFLYNSFPV